MTDTSFDTGVQPCQCSRFHAEHLIALITVIYYLVYRFLFRGKLAARHVANHFSFQTLAYLVPSLRAMDAHAHHVLQAIRSKSVTLDAKLEELRKFKALIKHNAVPESAATIAFEIIRNAIDSPQLAILGFSMLTHLIKRYVIQNLQAALCIQAKSTYPLLVRALGSSKDSVRSCAIKALVELWAIFPGDVEEVIRDKGLTTTRCKVSAMHWITSMKKERELPFKSFVPHIIDCVKDADAAVKHAAISSLVQLFSNVSGSAKEDLKKQLVHKYIQREAIAQIYSGLEIELEEEIVHKNPLKVDHAPSGYPRDQPPSTVSTEIGQHWDPIPIFSYEYLQDMFRNMEQCFEGKESEANWAKREFHVIELRRLCRGNAPEHYTSIFLTGIKTLLDGLLKTVNSLRTTLSNNGCLLIVDLAKAFGPALDGMVEILMQTLIKLCGATKTITAENGNHTVQAILSNVTFNNRLLQHIWNACQDKNSRPRQFATNWLNIVISKNGHNMNVFEHGSGIDLIERCLKRGLSDMNPQVRESMRATFWTYYRLDKSRSKQIMGTMDPKHHELLLKHSANPNPAELSDVSSSTTSDGKKSGMARIPPKTLSKPSLREAMLAQKRAKQAASEALERPSSPLPTAGSLNSAPVRPLRPAKKEIIRPGTADPTQARKPIKVETKIASPRAPSIRPRPKSSMAMNRSTAKPTAVKIEAPVIDHTEKLEVHSAGDNPRNESAPIDDVDTRIGAPMIDGVNDGMEILSTNNFDVPEETPPATDTDVEPEGLPVTETEITTEALPVIDTNTRDDAPSIIEAVITMELASVNDINAEAVREERVVAPTVEDSALIAIPREVPASIDVVPLPPTPITTAVDQGHSHAHPGTPSSTLFSYSVVSVVPALDYLRPTPPITPRLLQPDNISPPSSPLKIYEDPCRTDEIVHRAPYNAELVQALAELDINYERHKTATPERRSPERVANRAAWRKAEETENRKSGSLDLPSDMVNDYKTIDGCIRAIRARVMDNYGFRALQKIIRINDIRVWGDGIRFEALLFATIEYLEKPKPSLDVSTQLMITLRVMMRTHHSKFDTYDPRVLCALITCRRYYKATHHVVSGIEESCDDIICQTLVPIQCLDAVLDTIETETDDEPGQLSVTMGIYALQLLLDRISTSTIFGPADLDTAVWRRLMKLTRTLLISDCVQVRMVSYEFCISVYKAAPVPLAIWEDLQGLTTDAKALMQYYISRWEKNVAAGLEASS